MSRKKVYAVNISKTKLLMKVKGLTQVKLGELVGTSHQTIGKFKWNRNMLLNVCDILCCKPEDILLQELGEDTEIYRFTFRELKEHDKEIYNKALDDFISELDYKCGYDESYDDDCVYEIARDKLLSIIEKLKERD